MKTTIFSYPFSEQNNAFFESIVETLYKGAALSIKKSQAFGRDYLKYGLILQDSSEQVVARIGIYDNPNAGAEARDSLFWGAYECVNSAEISQAILSAARAFSRKNFPDKTQIIGPIDGSTWSNYRFTLPENFSRPFFSEPLSQAYYPQQWESFGFLEHQKYISNLAEASEPLNLEAGLKHFESQGIIFRNFDPNNAAAELEILARLNLNSFARAFLYTPISEPEFVEKYQPLLPYLKPDLIWLAQDGDALAGMILGLHDHLDPYKKTVVVKTLARLPDKKYTGLGEVLCGLITRSLRAGNYTHMVHALMRSGNASLKNSDHFWGKPFKQYVIYVLNV
jgi:hypothetical protein